MYFHNEDQISEYKIKLIVIIWTSIELDIVNVIIFLPSERVSI